MTRTDLQEKLELLLDDRLDSEEKIKEYIRNSEQFENRDDYDDIMDLLVLLYFYVDDEQLEDDLSLFSEVWE